MYKSLLLSFQTTTYFVPSNAAPEDSHPLAAVEIVSPAEAYTVLAAVTLAPP